MKKYLHLFLNHKFTLINLWIIAALTSAVGIVATFISGLFIDALIESTHLRELVNISIYLLLVFLAGIALRFIVGYLYGPLKERIVFDFKKHILRHRREDLNFEFS